MKHYLRAYELLDGPSFLSYEMSSWSFGCPYINFICHRTPGRFHVLKSHTDLHDAEFLVVTRGVGMGGERMVACEFHLERGEFAAAERLLADAETLVDEAEHTTTFLLLSFSRVRLLMARGKQDEAAALVQGIAARIERNNTFEHIVCHDLSLGYILATLGRTEGLPRWLADGNVYDPPYDMPHTQGLSLTVYGKILLARRDFAGLAKLLDTSPNGFGPFPMPLADIHIGIFKAILAKRRRDTDAAMRFIQAALDLSRPDGIVLTYSEHADAILSLLHRLRRSSPHDPHLEKVIALCKRAGRDAENANKYKKHLLSPRENKVMLLAAQGKPSRVIAHELGVSEPTVKSALSHVYAKLDVRNRVEAVRALAALRGQGGDSTTLPEASAAPGGRKGALTPREREIMRMNMLGVSRRAMATTLGISIQTVNRFAAMAYQKLKVTNRIQAARMFAKHYGE